MPSRRRVLAAGVLALTTGCLSDDAWVGRTDRRATTAESGSPADGSSGSTDGRDQSTGTGDECQRGYDVDADAFAPVETLPVGLREPERQVVADAVSNDGTTVETYWDAPVRSGVYVEFDGAYYRTSYTEGSAEEVPAREMSVRWEADQRAPDSAEVLAYDELPESDRRALEATVYGDRSEGRGHPTQTLEHRDFPAPYPDGTDDSTLVDRGEAWVEWDGRVYEVRVGGETTNARRTFEYDATEVASSDDAFRRYVDAEYVVALDDLSDGATAVVEDAVDGGYEECEPVSAGFESLRERLDDAPELPHPLDRRWFVEYDGERYLLGVFGWVV